MSRDANQIAQEHSRRTRTLGEPLGGGPATNTASPFQPPKPTRGTLTVWRDDYPESQSSMEFSGVTVRLDQPGVVILGSVEGSTYLLYPEPGWYCEFIPNDAGE